MMPWGQPHRPANPTRADLVRDLDRALHGVGIVRPMPGPAAWDELLAEVRQLVADRDQLRDGLTDLLTATNGSRP